MGPACRGSCDAFFSPSLRSPTKICHLNRSLQYAEKTAWGLVTIAQFGKEYVADHRGLVPARGFSWKKGT